MSNLKVLTNLDSKQDVYVSGSQKLFTSSSFNDTNIVTSSAGMYDVDGAIHALDSLIKQNHDNVQDAYSNVRYQHTASFNSEGTAELNLTLLANSSYFGVNNLKDINVQVMVDTNNDGHYTNDLLSIELHVSSSSLMLSIDAPGSPNKPYRVLAINETVLPL